MNGVQAPCLEKLRFSFLGPPRPAIFFLPIRSWSFAVTRLIQPIRFNTLEGERPTRRQGIRSAIKKNMVTYLFATTHRRHLSLALPNEKNENLYVISQNPIHPPSSLSHRPRESQEARNFPSGSVNRPFSFVSDGRFVSPLH